ncbi:MAG: pyridoxamine 5'-phosphate oxidase family protein [Sporichthyaceae bacterium]|nr:pyridoxamine 5'-phosphate oxidase family protein [Sporichthyaceae bacterium]
MDATAPLAAAKQIYRAHPTEAEIAEVLAMRLAATVGTLNEDGSIHLAYVIFLHEEGRLYFETASITRKARNAQARGRASMLVQGRASTGTSLMVAAEGLATVITGSRAHEINERLRAKYIKPEALDGVNQAWGPLDDVAVEIDPQTWRSWTSSRSTSTPRSR